jgi:hypothetical protein
MTRATFSLGASCLPLLVAVLLGAPRAQASSPCDGRDLPEGPLPIGFEQADFGQLRRACPRTEVGLSLGGRAIIEQENFYANLRGGARLDASFQPFPQLEVFASAEPFIYQQVIQSYRATHMGLGDSAVGATLLAFARDSFALSPTARVNLPTALGLYKNAFPVSVYLRLAPKSVGESEVDHSSAWKRASSASSSPSRSCACTAASWVLPPGPSAPATATTGAPSSRTSAPTLSSMTGSRWSST